MRYSQLILSLFLFFTFVIALPVPAPVEAVVARANSKKPSGNGTASKKNTKAEVAGIKENIDIQKKEKAKVKEVGKAEGTKNFDKTKGELVGTIKSGEKVRQDNQSKADPKNKDLVNGLKKAKEQKQAESLKGNKSTADKNTLKSLNNEINQGIKVNKGNEKAAKNGGKKGKGN
ncbi:hypothetical protein ColLi_07159 [Colletotrichum liriopes]|uniref:Secreted protein n=1 Tax=Colletotrichum liriopes TaxID=708192 RepID=A0AA37GQ01_9PEZI|nr:hypothetical protein ColLi_07159 [Colletotrichum liriopes]